jgi:hypothetical protein
MGADFGPYGTTAQAVSVAIAARFREPDLDFRCFLGARREGKGDQRESQYQNRYAKARGRSKHGEFSSGAKFPTWVVNHVGFGRDSVYCLKIAVITVIYVTFWK